MSDEIEYLEDRVLPCCYWVDFPRVEFSLHSLKFGSTSLIALKIRVGRTEGDALRRGEFGDLRAGFQFLVPLIFSLICVISVWRFDLVGYGDEKEKSGE